MTETHSPDEMAWNTALRLLEAGDKSRRELRDRLLQKRFADDVAQRVLDRLEARGFLNDKIFASRLADKLVSRKASQRKVEFEMRRRGVPTEFIQDELSKLEPDEDERLYQAGLKQWKRLSRLDPQDRTKRVFGVLARQGFDSEPIRRFMERILREETHQSEEQGYDHHE